MKIDSFLEKLEKKEILVYILTFLIFFLIFLFTTFPAEKIIVSAIDKFNEKSNARITYDSLDFSIFGGLKIKDFQLEAPEWKFGVKHLVLKPALFPLLTGKLRVWVNIRDPKGKVTGEIKGLKKGFALNLNLKDIHPEHFEILKNRIQTEISGNIMGKIKITFPGRLDRTKGLIVLEGKDLLARGGPYLSLIGMKELPLGELSVMTRIENGKLRIESFKLGEKDYYLKLGGNIQLRMPFSASTLNLQVRLKLNDTLQSKIGMFLPTAGFSKTPGGLYSKRIYGRVAFLLR